MLPSKELLPELGLAMIDLRWRLQFDTEQAAAEIGMDYSKLLAFEDGTLEPWQAAEVMEDMHDAWGIDLNMFSLAFLTPTPKFPSLVDGPAKTLVALGRQRIEKIIAARLAEQAE